MIIRKFEKKDLAQVLELCREVRQHHIDLLNGYFTEHNDAFEQSVFLESLESDNIIAFVAAENNNIIGYLLGEFKEAPYLVNPKVAYVSNFGISQNNRHKGIGRKLMDAFYQLCKENNIDEIRLGVYNQNTGAYRFYENYGFKPLEQMMVLDITNEKLARES
ncbi:MAG: GNAT family N-acetyltransferase [Alphaproteobacteria bacterium]|nr:GNAT family N-acetyltransferase [Alphaproteobacteria bacterium]